MSCELCDMARDATANIPRPTPKKAPARPKASPRTGATGSAPSTGYSTPPPKKEVFSPIEGEIFFPPVEPTSTPTFTASPRPAPAPPAPPGGWSSPGYTEARTASGGNGCAWALGIVSVVVFLALVSGCVSVISSLAGSEDISRDDLALDNEEPCPSRVAGLIPDEGRATLVEAFETDQHRIILCDDSSGQLYYHGEIPDSGEDPVLMEAETTRDGYIAWNGPYSYEITGDQVVVSNSSGELGRYTLYSWEDPS